MFFRGLQTLRYSSSCQPGLIHRVSLPRSSHHFRNPGGPTSTRQSPARCGTWVSQAIEKIQTAIAEKRVKHNRKTTSYLSISLSAVLQRGRFLANLRTPILTVPLAIYNWGILACRKQISHVSSDLLLRICRFRLGTTPRNSCASSTCQRT